MKVIAALVVSLGATSAYSAQTWVATHTKAHDVRTAVHLGVMNAGEMVHVAVSLQLRNKSQLDALTSQIMAGAHVKPLSHAEFMTRHAPTDEQVRQVVDYLTQQGFTNIEVAENHLLVTADGSAAAIKNAFKAELHKYSVNGRIAHANVTDAEVPASLAGTVNAVLGLQNVHMAHVTAKRLTTPQFTTNSVVAVNPTLFPSIYSASSLPSATNATIGIITAGKMTQTITDLKQFASNAGYPVPPVTTVQVGTAGSSTSGTDEWNMDSQSSLAAAGGTIKSMLLYTATDLSDSALTADYNKVVSDNKAKVINVSLGECENDAKSSGIEASNDQIFQSAVAQGQTFSVSSGDSGSYECGGSTSYQSYPAVSPYVMAIGGTTLSTSGGTWVSETAWSCTSASNCPQSASGGTGGGVSATEAAPSYQINSGVLAGSTKRGVPDVSFDASPNSGALVLINGSNAQIGGTSLAAPLFAGFYSRIQSANGNTLPFPAATLYQGAAANPGWFHDVTSGTNGGYSAKAGWDYVTGYGSLVVSNFATAFSGGGGGGGTGGTPSANFSYSVNGLTASFTDTSTDAGGAIGSHSWTFGDGSSSTAANPSHTYSAAGTYSVTETVTDSVNAQTSSKTQSVTVTSSGGGGGGQLLGNTGFESGAASPWTMSSGSLCSNSSCSGETAHGGSWFAWLDGYGSSHTDTVSQAVTIPAGKSSASLSFYLHIDTSETTGSTAYDKLTVQVTSGGTTKTIATYSNLNKNSGYALHTLSLNSYIGKAVTIKFTGKEDSSLQTSFVLDDITLNVQ
jgi:xanthomonalisin